MGVGRRSLGKREKACVCVCIASAGEKGNQTNQMSVCITKYKLAVHELQKTLCSAIWLRGSIVSDRIRCYLCSECCTQAKQVIAPFFLTLKISKSCVWMHAWPKCETAYTNDHLKVVSA